jgi:uncharacterized membrane protein
MEKYFSIISLIISISSFLTMLLAKDTKKKVVLAVAASVALTIISVVTYVDADRHARHIKRVMADITEVLESRSMTFDQLYSELFFTSHYDLNEALGNMTRERTVWFRNLEVHDKKGERYFVKGFYCRATKQKQ